jgi:CDP-diacylglycerol--glycerol-3-phosphate 3-phosphatidyltransferase
MAKIFSVDVKAGAVRAFNPIINGLLRAGVPPDAVTVFGCLGVIASSIFIGAQGHLIAGPLVITAFALTDVVDGAMARRLAATGKRRGKFGSFLDSTLDRVSDGAVFSALAYLMATADFGSRRGMFAALICLVTGQVVPYARAKAESLGFAANVGVAERFERLVIIGIGSLIQAFGVPNALEIATWVLVALSLWTVWQRLATVYRQDRQA